MEAHACVAGEEDQGRGAAGNDGMTPYRNPRPDAGREQPRETTMGTRDENLTTPWVKGNLGWSRMYYGHALTVQGYPSLPPVLPLKGRARRGYVPRIDNSAPTSPARPEISIAKAKQAAERFVDELRARRIR